MRQVVILSNQEQIPESARSGIAARLTLTGGARA